jgi:hypothetical protein
MNFVKAWDDINSNNNRTIVAIIICILSFILAGIVSIIIGVLL